MMARLLHGYSRQTAGSRRARPNHLEHHFGAELLTSTVKISCVFANLRTTLRLFSTTTRRRAGDSLVFCVAVERSEVMRVESKKRVQYSDDLALFPADCGAAAGLHRFPGHAPLCIHCLRRVAAAAARLSRPTNTLRCPSTINRLHNTVVAARHLPSFIIRINLTLYTHIDLPPRARSGPFCLPSRDSC